MKKQAFAVSPSLGSPLPMAVRIVGKLVSQVAGQVECQCTCSSFGQKQAFSQLAARRCWLNVCLDVWQQPNNCPTTRTFLPKKKDGEWQLVFGKGIKVGMRMALGMEMGMGMGLGHGPGHSSGTLCRIMPCFGLSVDVAAVVAACWLQCSVTIVFFFSNCLPATCINT